MMCILLGCDLYGSGVTIRVMTYEMVLWAEHVAHIKETVSVRKMGFGM
jgi:hypothetical protein